MIYNIYAMTYKVYKIYQHNRIDVVWPVYFRGVTVCFPWCDRVFSVVWPFVFRDVTVYFPRFDLHIFLAFLPVFWPWSSFLFGLNYLV